MSFADFFERVQRSGFYQARLKEFLSFVDPKAEMRALDVGCGPGALIIEVAKRVKEAVGAGLREMRRVLKVGGIAADMDPSTRMTHERIDKFAREQELSEFEWDALHGWLSAAQYNHRFSPDSIRELYEGAGLEVLEIKEYMDGMVIFCKGIKPD